MSFNNVSAGKEIPNDINVIIEIPMHGAPVKYEVDKDSGTLHVDRFLATAMYYPCNYGYVPRTLADDGDPVDVLVLASAPLLSGAVVRSRPIGMLKMSDEKGEDAKILAVPITKLAPQYANLKTPDDVGPQLLDTIAHFFEHYKDLEKGKWVKIGAWVGAEEAKQEIMQSVERYQAT